MLKAPLHQVVKEELRNGPCWQAGTRWTSGRGFPRWGKARRVLTEKLILLHWSPGGQLSPGPFRGINLGGFVFCSPVPEHLSKPQRLACGCAQFGSLRSCFFILPLLKPTRQLSLVFTVKSSCLFQRNLFSFLLLQSLCMSFAQHGSWRPPCFTPEEIHLRFVLCWVQPWGRTALARIFGEILPGFHAGGSRALTRSLSPFLPHTQRCSRRRFSVSLKPEWMSRGSKPRFQTQHPASSLTPGGFPPPPPRAGVLTRSLDTEQEVMKRSDVFWRNRPGLKQLLHILFPLQCRR